MVFAPHRLAYFTQHNFITLPPLWTKMVTTVIKNVTFQDALSAEGLETLLHLSTVVPKACSCFS